MSLFDHTSLLGKNLEEAVAIVMGKLPKDYRKAPYSATFQTYNTDYTVEVRNSSVVVDVISDDAEGLQRLSRSRRLKLTIAGKTYTERFRLIEGTVRPPLRFPATGSSGLPSEIPNKDWIARATFKVQVNDVAEISLELLN